MSDRIIKKYPNRRLYDISTRQHINLEEIKELVKNYETFKVVDSKTGEDITHQILLQILIESLENGSNSILTQETLAQLIRMSDSPVGAGFAEYFEKLLEVYVKQREFMIEQLNRSFTSFNPFDLGDKIPGGEGMWEAWRSMMSPTVNHDQAKPEKTDKKSET